MQAPPPPRFAAPYSALVLAGGRGERMGGLDKGLQPWRGRSLAWNALERLAAQTHPPVHRAVSANRNPALYGAFGVPVWPDSVGGFAGPLAGMLTGLAHCKTPWLLCVPCDVPAFPLDLAVRLGDAAERAGAGMAIAAAPDPCAGDTLRTQPVLCLLRADLRANLGRFLQAGGRSAGAWAAGQACAIAAFDQPHDDAHAFDNINTLAQLAAVGPGLRPDHRCAP